MNVQYPATIGCERCADGTGAAFPLDLAMAFQPIVSTTDGTIFAHEALVRGAGGEGAGEVIAAVDADNMYAFDQACRVTAIAEAARAGIAGPISINFMPNAVYEPATCIRKTLQAARRHRFPIENIIFEITEHEQVVNVAHLRRIVMQYQRMGFRTAIDDFGAGHSGLGLLADIQPDFIKIDRALVTGIDTDRVRRAIAEGIVHVAAGLGIVVIAEGVETAAEVGALGEIGIDLMQGYHFARPRFREGWRREELSGL